MSSMERRHTRRIAIFFLAAGLTSFQVHRFFRRPAGGAAVLAATPNLMVDGSRRFQRIDGFGVNANPKHWHGGELIPALDLLVDTLGATLWRVDVFGKSTWEATNDDSDPFHFSWDQYTSIYESSDFQKLWNMLAYLNQKGVQILFSASGIVPDWMGGTAIDPGQEDEFVEMIVSAAYYARNMKHLQLTMLDPLNETNFGPPEGPKVDPTQYARIMGKLAARLDALGMSDMRLVAPETTSFNTEYLPPLMANPAVMAHLDQFAFHSYSGSGDGFALSAIQQSAYPDRRVWVTEWSQIVTDGSLDGGVQVKDEWAFAREMTDELFNHLEEGASAVLSWDAYDNVHEHDGSGKLSHWGLLAYDPTTGTYTPKPRFYTNAQVFKFVPPGSMRIDASTDGAGVRALAFVDDLSGTLTITGRNFGTSPAMLTGSLANVPPITAFHLYQTTAGAPLAIKPDVPVAGGTFSVEVAADSFFTLTGSPAMEAARGVAAPLPLLPA